MNQTLFSLAEIDLMNFQFNFGYAQENNDELG